MKLVLMMGGSTEKQCRKGGCIGECKWIGGEGGREEAELHGDRKKRSNLKRENANTIIKHIV